MATVGAAAEIGEESVFKATLVGIYRYLRRNPTMVAGMLVLFSLVLFWAIGSVMTDPSQARTLANRPSQSPSFEHLVEGDEAVLGRFMSSRMGRLPEHFDGKLVARSNWHSLVHLAVRRPADQQVLEGAGLERCSWRRSLTRGLDL